MAELTDSRMNVAALKRVDPYVKNLLETAAHVALYTFNANDNEWEKTEIEGALFVYSRTGEPYNNILIMNRLNMKNLIEPVTQGLDLQLQDPFLLYRNTHGKIYGIWFYDKEECVKIASTLTKLVKETAENKNQGIDKKAKRKNENNVSGVDIFTMLTKAQQEFNSKSPLKGQTEFVGTPPDTNNLCFSNVDSTPQSVMDFFAKASSGVPHFIQDITPGQLSGTLPEALFLGMARPGPPGLTQIQPMPIGIPPPQSDVKPLLQRLMSNPAHSVEHIEKQQRSITPQTELAALMKNKCTSLTDSNKRNSLGNGFKGLNIISSTQNNVKQLITSQAQLENEIGFLRIADTSSPTTIVQTQQFFNSGLAQQNSPTGGDVPVDVNSAEHRSLSAPQASAMETPTKPALMPPVMFTSSATKDEPSPIISVMMPAINVVPASTQQNNNNSLQLRPEPLTKNQLLQAFSYLLKNDPNFINQLHEAYVKSFA